MKETAAVLAGGFGTRLRAVMADRPKVLARVGDRPYLSYLLDRLAGDGVATVVLCTGYLGDQVEAEFGAAYGGMKLLYSREEVPLGTGGALRNALPLFAADPILVLNGDSYCPVDLQQFRHEHASRGVTASIVVVEMPNSTRFGAVNITPDARILRFEEKSTTQSTGWVSAGIYLLNRSVVEAIPAGWPVSLERRVFPALTGGGVHAFRTSGPLLDIGTPESYESAERILRQLANIGGGRPT